MIKDLYQPLYYFVKQYPLMAFIVVIALLVSGLAEGIGLMALLPLLQIVLNDGALNDSKINLFFQDFFAALGLEITLVNTLIFIVGFICIKAITKLMAMYIVSDTASEITANFRNRLAEALMKARWRYFTEKPAGYISTAMNNESLYASNCIIKGCSLLAEIFQICIYLSLAFYISWWVTLAALLFGGLGALLLRQFFRIAREAGEAQTENQKALIGNVLDIFRIMKPIRAMGRETYLGFFINEKITALKKAYRSLLFVPYIIEQSNEILRVLLLSVGLFFLIGVWNSNIEELFLLAILFIRILQRVNLLQKSYIILSSQLPSFFYTTQMVDAAETMHEQWNGKKKAVFNEAITFDKVTYRHDKKTLFEKASFQIPAHGLNIISGPSGAGKSTMVDLLCGLYAAEEGQILIDHTALGAIDVLSWRNQIGYVPQDAILLHDTVRNNITLFDPNISDADLMEALKRAGALEFVEALKDGLDSNVGEGGSQLSGGQRQRIVMARALVKKPKLLILDEATSGLEEKVEDAIIHMLKEFSDEICVLLITHNKSLKKHADRFYELSDKTLKETV
ncbi:MAG: ABC transporter ATP-binding protein [Rhodospirillales bacterium]|nr:ABC transporter ATP-binding protein [Rhodospirillales bacterium]